MTESKRKLMAHWQEAALVSELAYKSRVHLLFLIDPRLADRFRGQQHQKMRAVAETLINRLAQAVTRGDAPLVPLRIDTVCLQRRGDTTGNFCIIRCVGQEHARRTFGCFFFCHHFLVVTHSLTHQCDQFR